VKLSELFFYALPVWLPAGFFALISAINFDYERKFFEPATVNGLADALLGLKLLSVAAVASIASSVFLFVMRRNFQGRHSRSNAVIGWLYIILPGVVSFVLCLAAIFIVVLGPAAITMLQQMRN